MQHRCYLILNIFSSSLLLSGSFPKWEIRLIIVAAVNCAFLPSQQADPTFPPLLTWAIIFLDLPKIQKWRKQQLGQVHRNGGLLLDLQFTGILTNLTCSSKSLATTALAQEDELSDSETHPEYIRALNDIQGVRDAKRKKLQIRRDCELRSLHEWHKVQCKQAWDAYNVKKKLYIATWLWTRYN